MGLATDRDENENVHFTFTETSNCEYANVSVRIWTHQTDRESSASPKFVIVNHLEGNKAAVAQVAASKNNEHICQAEAVSLECRPLTGECRPELHRGNDTANDINVTIPRHMKAMDRAR